MKRNVFLFFFIIIGLGSCKEKIPPLSERIQATWILAEVKEGATLVYSKGANTNIRAGYANWRLVLSGQSVVYTEFDNTRFSGQYELQNDTKLILKNLTPKPSATDGTLEFMISEATDEQMILKSAIASLKTGNSINEYKLIKE